MLTQYSQKLKKSQEQASKNLKERVKEAKERAASQLNLEKSHLQREVEDLE